MRVLCQGPLHFLVVANSFREFMTTTGALLFCILPFLHDPGSQDWFISEFVQRQTWKMFGERTYGSVDLLSPHMAHTNRYLPFREAEDRTRVSRQLPVPAARHFRLPLPCARHLHAILYLKSSRRNRTSYTYATVLVGPGSHFAACNFPPVSPRTFLKFR